MHRAAAAPANLRRGAITGCRGPRAEATAVDPERAREAMLAVLAACTAHRPPPLSLDRRSFSLAAAACCTSATGSRALASQLEPAAGRISGGDLPIAVGLGTCLVRDGQVPNNMGIAIDAGYRIFDTAQRYANEGGVGKALKTAMASRKVTRDELFVTTKVWVDNMGAEKTLSSVRKSADDLGLSRIDLVLIHWPGLFQKRGTEYDAINADLRRGTWTALEALQAEGLISRIGVANFSERHLRELLGYAKTKPAVNQIEIHPYNQRTKLVDLCRANGVAVNSYCPIGGRGNKGQVTDALLADPTLVRIAKAHGKTAAQVILRWHLQRGLTPIPKASSKARADAQPWPSSCSPRARPATCRALHRRCISSRTSVCTTSISARVRWRRYAISTATSSRSSTPMCSRDVRRLALIRDHSFIDNPR